MDDKQKLLEEIKKSTNDKAIIQFVEERLKLYDTVDDFLSSMGIDVKKTTVPKSIPSDEVYEIDLPYAITSIIRKLSRPGFFVQSDSLIDSNENQNLANKSKDFEDWFSLLKAGISKWQNCAKATGKIVTAENKSLGTGYAIFSNNKNLVITAGHVAKQIIKETLNTSPVFIDFSSEYNGKAPSKIRIIDYEKSNQYDLAFLFLETIYNQSLSLNMLDPIPPNQCSSLCAVGYPDIDSGVDPSYIEFVFGDRSRLGYKRISPGKIENCTEPVELFCHDCSTLNKSSGSPIVCIDTGKIVGLHIEGGISRNASVQGWAILEELKILNINI